MGEKKLTTINKKLAKFFPTTETNNTENEE